MPPQGTATCQRKDKTLPEQEGTGECHWEQIQLLASSGRRQPRKTLEASVPTWREAQIKQSERPRADSSSSSHAGSRREEPLCPEDQCMHICIVP